MRFFFYSVVNNMIFTARVAMRRVLRVQAVAAFLFCSVFVNGFSCTMIRPAMAAGTPEQALLQYYEAAQQEDLDGYYRLLYTADVSETELAQRKELTSALWRRFDTRESLVQHFRMVQQNDLAVGRYSLASILIGPTDKGDKGLLQQYRQYAVVFVRQDGEWKIVLISGVNDFDAILHASFRQQAVARLLAVLDGTVEHEPLQAATVSTTEQVVEERAAGGESMPGELAERADVAVSDQPAMPELPIPESLSVVAVVAPAATEEISAAPPQPSSETALPHSPSNLEEWVSVLLSGQEVLVALDQLKVDDTGWTGDWRTDPLGVIKGGEIYTVVFKEGMYSATGLHEPSGEIQTHASMGIDPADGLLAIWGRTFNVDGKGRIWDPEFGIAGSLAVKEMAKLPATTKSTLLPSAIPFDVPHARVQSPPEANQAKAVEAVEAVETAKAAEPEEIVTPAESAGVVKAAEAVKSADPAEVVAAEEPAEPVNAEAVKAAEPAEVVTATEGAKPVEPAKMIVTAEAAEAVKPEEAMKPIETAHVVESGASAQAALFGTNKDLFSGEWATTYGDLFLEQTDGRVSGKFGDKGGRLTGEIEDTSVVRGLWSKEGNRCSEIRDGRKSWGSFEFHFSPDGGFDGSWGYCESGLNSVWTGKRKEMQPDLFRSSDAAGVAIRQESMPVKTNPETEAKLLPAPLAESQAKAPSLVVPEIPSPMVVSETVMAPPASALEPVVKGAASSAEGVTRAVQPSPTEDIVSGVWVTNYGELSLQLTGRQVSGSYTNNGGILSGTLNEDSVVEGIWSEIGRANRCNTEQDGRTNWGRFEFHFTDVNSFTGKWGYCDKALAGDWNGTAQKSPVPVALPTVVPLDPPSRGGRIVPTR